ncbi:hypothetical protein SASPL_115701 [Salvia splendens]|uniref:Myb/SANT-like domain-containing protein n=1 Tax=Salvia splendens TaxID=180675 RepID=A0A8X8Y3N6_SALSN|nr:hypothetical protein SASPL_115701 [Salvia splendens]
MASPHRSANDNDGSPLPDGSSDMVPNKGVIAAAGAGARRCWTERYLTRALEALKREFPKTDICVHPHIKSKITTWKKNYYSLMQILDRSGVGFNADGDFKIDIDDEQWTQVVAKDINAKYMRNKSWPMFNDWKEIFGKDRADGLNVMDTGEAVQKIYGSKADAGSSSVKSSPMTLDELFPDEVFTGGVVPEMMDSVLAMMNRIHEDTNERLKDISNRIGYEFDLSTKRTEVFNQLKGMAGLTIKQQFYAAKKLVKEPELMDLFRGLDEWARPAFVLDLLETDGMI